MEEPTNVACNPRIIGIALITTDLARACAFYEQALGFDPVSSVRYDSAEVATLRLGEETLHLVRPDRPGRTYPEPQAANDPWFQHFAIAVSDAAAAFERLSRMPFTPISRGGPILLPPSSGSVIAYKFRDPDGHPLELSQFPDDRWTRRRTAPGPFLGIDHTAIAVSDLDRSLAFYSGTLGFEFTARGVNAGPSQDALDGLGGAQVEIAVMSPPSSKGPHLELLHYLSPVPVKGRQAVWIEDVAATRTLITVEDLPSATLRDPDGHIIATQLW
jgi:catechol 2,3-dioxygenase-like lactoylglutathione lyase family enzyme